MADPVLGDFEALKVSGISYRLDSAGEQTLVILRKDWEAESDGWVKDSFPAKGSGKAGGGDNLGEQNGGLLLQSSSEYREVAAAGPYGVKSLPPAGENAVGVVSGEKTFCLGVEIDPKGLAAGRAGSVFLRRSENHPDPDGKIQLEGQVFINGAEQ